ncbi:MAG: efflux transporter outer membrane subunit [Pseudomonadales bacterium]|nr:efflux transporter outer membrane subunit [Pseudomonadales bacterium]
MRVSKFIILPAMVLLISSCATNSAKQASQQAVKQAIETPESWAIKAQQYNDDSINWLKTFNDPMLLKFIAEGKANNLDLQVAAGNMDRAWLLAKQSGAALKPTVDLSLGRTQSGSTDGGVSNSNVAVGLDVSWELDVWGRISAGVDAATATAQAAEADYNFAQHSLSANIANTYFLVIEATLQADITVKNLATLEKGMRITQAKYDNGLSSGQDVALTRANLASAKEQLIQIEGSERDALRALEVLLGRYPDASVEMPDTLPDLPQQPPAGIPSELLERRPDIVSAERQIASAFSATDQAKAARLPSFSLTTSLSGASSSLSDVLKPTNVAWKLAGNLMAPLFDGGRRKIDIEIATVEQKQAIANYAQAALTAFSEIENNLDQGAVLANRETALSEAFRQSDKAYSIAELRYEEGEIELLDALQIQQQAISAESQLLSIKRAQLEQRINFYLALGGSW